MSEPKTAADSVAGAAANSSADPYRADPGRPGAGLAAETIGSIRDGTADASQAPDAASIAQPTSRPPDAQATVGEAASDFALGPETAGAARADETYTVPGEPGGTAEAAGPSLAGYEILNELGRGGMGIVYRARQIGLNRLVALKMVLAGSHAPPEQLARFHAEAEAVARLQHPNIVQIHEVGTQGGLPYFSLEFVDGQTLTEKLGGKPLAPAEAAALIATLARAMDYAHQRGIVHRDLKPGNVLLTAAGVPKITDFGLAKRLEADSSQTRTGAIMGTPSYMAPEQARGENSKIGPAADVYALGAILYELLTGRAPFLAASPLDTVMQVVRDDPLPPTRLQPKLPRDLETICLKCLQKEAAKRYLSAAALADDLARYRAGEPILARPISPPERLWRWCRRNPRVASLAAAVIILPSIAAVWAFQEKNRAVASALRADQNAAAARQATQEAEAARDLAQQQAELALDSHRTLIKLVKDKLRDTPGMQDLRRDVLATALGGLQKVLPSEATATLTDRSMAGAHQEMGDLYLELGATQKALEEYQRSYDFLKRIAADEPDQALARRNLAAASNNLADVSLRLGRFESALDYRLKALGLRREWSELQPDSTGATQAIAISHGLVGEVYLEMGRLDEARQSMAAAQDVWDELDRVAFESNEAKAAHAVLYDNLADLSLRSGAPEAVRSYRAESWKLIDPLVGTDPDGVRTAREMRARNMTLGDKALLEERDSRSAIDYYEAARHLAEKLLAVNPRDAGARRDVADTQYRIGAAYDRLGTPDAARPHFAEALAIRRDLAGAAGNDAAARVALMVALPRTGRHREGAEIAAALTSEAPAKPWILYNAACCYALCAGATRSSGEPGELEDHYRELAITTLRQAMQHNWRDAASLKMDPDFDPIRDHPAFQELVQELERSGAG